MTTPRTELDTRFSEPGAQPTSWEDTLEAIKQAEIFWISTVRAHGRPHVTPLVAVWLDDALHFSTGPDEQKAHNLAGNSYVALTTGANGWEGGLDVVVEGEAARVTDSQQLGAEVGRAMAIRGQSGWLSTRRRARVRVRRPTSEGTCLREGRLQPHPTSLLTRDVARAVPWWHDPRSPTRHTVRKVRS
jgi:nitroimidazol reductase NimA-like FMN-containing flavoprotein (pyridoxamine 5'-phosphate oxidase superfamily)